MSLRVLIHSNASHTSTGYGNQCKNLVRILQSLGHSVGEFAFYGLEGGMIVKGDVPIYPKGFSAWGDDILVAHAAHFEADLVISLVDSWVLDMNRLKGARVALWAPVDHEPIPQGIANNLRQCWQPIMYSRFGQRMAAEAGVPCAYAPHAIDTEFFVPINREDARRALGWPSDKFVVVTVAANKGYPSRKNWPQMIRAFASFRETHPDAVWYLHTTMGQYGEMGGVNLPQLIEAQGLQSACLFPDQYGMVLGYPDETMRLIYSAADVFYLPSSGEGFGIPLIEALACGTPILTGNWTAMEDFTDAPGWFISKADAEPFDTPLNAAQYIPHIDAIAETLNQAYADLATLTTPESKLALRLQCRAVAERYSLANVAQQHWTPLLADIEARIVTERGASFPGHQHHAADVRAAAQIANPAERYAFWLTHWSDIQTHLPTFYARAQGLVVELGSRSGVSTSALVAGVMSNGGMVVSVDTDPACGQLFTHSQWRFVQGSSTDLETVERALGVRSVAHDGIDVLLVDTEHTYAQVMAELTVWGPALRPGATVFFHDTESFPEVKRAVEEWCKLHALAPEFASGSNGLGIVAITHESWPLVKVARGKPKSTRPTHQATKEAAA